MVPETFIVFSPNRPTGPIWSSSCDVRLLSVVCSLPMQLSKGSKGGSRGAKLTPCHQYTEKMYIKMYIFATFSLSFSTFWRF